MLSVALAGAGAAMAACGESGPPGGPLVSRPSVPAPGTRTPAPGPALERSLTPRPESPTPRAGVLTPVVTGSPPAESPTPMLEPSAAPEPTPRLRPTPRVAATPQSQPEGPAGVPVVDGATVDLAFSEERIWRHWDRAQAYFAQAQDVDGAREFHAAVAIAFAHGRPDIGEYLAAEGLASVQRSGSARRLAALDLGGRVAGWLPASVRASLREPANTVYAEAMTREALTVDPPVVTTLLRQLRTIRGSTGLAGVHWPDPGRQYRDGTPFVERVVSFAGTDAEYHLERVRMRVAKLRDRHPDSPIIVRVDYRPGQAIPRNEAERAEYYPQLEQIISAPEFQGLILQQGNEPQFDGNPTPAEIAREFIGWGVADTDTGDFWSRCDTFNPTARRLPMPVAPFHPDGPEEPNPPGLEDSPWARMAYQTKWRILQVGRARDRVPHGWAEHVYGDPRPDRPGADREAWADRRDPTMDFRWGVNVAETWQEINALLERQTGVPPLPVWVTEFNSAARGTEPPNQPADNYAPGWMIHALARMTVAFPTLQGACWFVADSYNHDTSWTRFALHERHGRMADADRDFEALQQAGV